jgi:hypothetical protein
MPKNENGVYEPEITHELARRGRSYASVKIARCDDGLYRFALDMEASDRGFCGPITDRGTGHASSEAAKTAAAEKLLQRFPTARASDPESVQNELRELKAQVEQTLREPTLF